ncbi:MAG: hypothetical protein JNK31_03145 [Candidatus Competibacter sp.]|nr:hypothetical protein [Candidatus Competibacter sp.]
MNRATVAAPPPGESETNATPERSAWQATHLDATGRRLVTEDAAGAATWIFTATAPTTTRPMRCLCSVPRRNSRVFWLHPAVWAPASLWAAGWERASRRWPPVFHVRSI